MATQQPAAELDPVVRQHIEEVQKMRGEIDWRVRAAYASSVAFISVISFAVTTLFDDSNQFLEKARVNDLSFILTMTAITLFFAAFLGVQNANHLVEKRIELYSLQLMRLIKARSGEVFASWLGFLYGHPNFNNARANRWAKVLNASIGFFQYFLPNLVVLGLGAMLWWSYGEMDPATRNWLVLLAVMFATGFLLLAVGTTVFLFTFVKRLDKQMTAFYDAEIGPLWAKLLKDDSLLAKARKPPHRLKSSRRSG